MSTVREYIRVLMGFKGSATLETLGEMVAYVLGRFPEAHKELCVKDIDAFLRGSDWEGTPQHKHLMYAGLGRLIAEGGEPAPPMPADPPDGRPIVRLDVSGADEGAPCTLYIHARELDHYGEGSSNVKISHGISGVVMYEGYASEAPLSRLWGSPVGPYRCVCVSI